jgi:transposase
MQDKRRWLPRWQRVELVELCVEQGLTRRVSVATVQYWVKRWREATEVERATGSWAQDRPSTPHRQPSRVSEEVRDRVWQARARTGWGPRLIASELGMAHATVSRCLQRRGMSRPPRREPETVRRFEWPCPGDLLQMDTKRFGRFSRPGHKVTGDRYRTGAEKRARVGWEYCHSIIDDHSRLAYSELHRDEHAETVTAFVARALHSSPSTASKPSDCRPTTPGPTSKTAPSPSCSPPTASSTAASPRAPPNATERYQQTLAREWACRQRYRNSDARATALPIWLTHHNTTRNHSSISNQPPITRVRDEPRQNN